MIVERINIIVIMFATNFYINSIEYVFYGNKNTMTLNKIFCIISLSLSSLMGIYIFFAFSLVFSENSPYIPIIISSFTYIRRCILEKKYIPPPVYAFCFLVESLSYIVEVASLFGRFYIKPILDIDVYFRDESVFFVFCRKCFDIGLKNFFTSPAVYSIDNPHFIQFCFGIIIAGSIVASLIKIISFLVAPDSQQDKLHD